MSDRKSGKPLFELLSTERSETKGLGGTTNPEIGTKPKDAPDAVPEPSGEERAQPVETPAPRSSAVNTSERAAAIGYSTDPSGEQDHEIRMTMPRFYLALAGVLTLVVIVWATAFQMGVNSGKAQMEPLIDQQDVVLPRGGAVADTSGDPDGSGSVQVLTEPPVDSGARARASVLSSGGDFIPDPRRSGHNYLQLGALAGSEARDAMSFFAANGVTLIGVPLDSGRGGDNNTLRFMLFSTGLSVPSERYRAMAPERAQHKRVVASVGERWQRERRGGSDFSESKTLWVKYE